MKKYVLAAFVFAVAFTFAVGCAPKKKEVEIEGTATIDGTPIDLGIVQFFNDKSEGGGNVQEGRYTAKAPEDMWQKPTMKITVNKGGTYDLEFKSEK